MNEIYVDTVRLMLGIAPIVFDTPLFAMKGGTALNLFLQDMPRLSVDIDVVLTDRTLSRDDAVAAISKELSTIDFRTYLYTHLDALLMNQEFTSGASDGVHRDLP